MYFFVAIFLSIWTLSLTQDFNGASLSKAQKRHAPLYPSFKHTLPKTLLVKRIPGLSTHPSKGSSRILNKTPLNLLQNGPYYINHYIYCDNVDQHTLDQIKTGAYSSNKEIQLLNLQKGEFHSGSFPGNKEFHVLHLPKDKHPNFNDVNLHLSLLNAHKSPEAPEIDLELNKHLANFDVNLDGVKPLDIDTTHLDTALHSSANDVVTPLIQGQVNGFNHGHNEDLVHVTEYWTNHGSVEKEPVEHYGSFNGHGSNSKGEILDLPHFEKHPLEHDPNKASYDTPGAVDSYGHPATASPPNFHSDFNTEGFPGGFENGIKGNDLYQAEDFISKLNEINGLQRRRRMDAYMSSSTEKSIQEAEDKDEVRYPNHKYE